MVAFGVGIASGCAVAPSTRDEVYATGAMANPHHFLLYDNEKDSGPNHLAKPARAPGEGGGSGPGAAGAGDEAASETSGDGGASVQGTAPLPVPP